MELEVELSGVAVGTLATGPSGAISFKFHGHYIDGLASERAILGQAFEEDLRRVWRASGRLPAFFSNLLPEGAMRQLVAKQVGVGEHREAQLLVRLGRDLPGAVTVTPLTEVDAQELPWPNDEQEPAEEAPLRFSLAGVQTKFSVLREADKFVFPARGMGGDWIVKLPDLEFEEVPENGYSMMTWAARAGLRVPDFELVESSALEGLPRGLSRRREGLSYAVRRFDRSPNGPVHIEDFAQVFTVYPEAKYDRFNYESIANVIATTCEEGSLREYVRRLVFTVVSGNADMHLKNWSLRYPGQRAVELGPAYDMVSTVVYPDVERSLALRFSKSKSFDAVELGHFRRMFERIGRSADEAAAWVGEDLDRILDAWAELRGQLPLSPAARAAVEAHQRRLALVHHHRLRPA